MTDNHEVHDQWMPLAGLPESVLARIALTYSNRTLVVEAYYPRTTLDGFLWLSFEVVEAFKVYEEFSDPWMQTRTAQPMIGSAQRESRVWPFQEIRNSLWCARVLDRNPGLLSGTWRHFAVVTQQDTLHVLTDGDPDAKLIRG